MAGRSKVLGKNITGSFPDRRKLCAEAVGIRRKDIYAVKAWFARDMEFDLESQTEEEIWFVLKDTESTLEKYPFHFILKVGYRLSDVRWK